jgi:hypothetical protein
VPSLGRRSGPRRRDAAFGHAAVQYLEPLLALAAADGLAHPRRLPGAHTIRGLRLHVLKRQYVPRNCHNIIIACAFISVSGVRSGEAEESQMPDLDLIKQGKQERCTTASGDS